MTIVIAGHDGLLFETGNIDRLARQVSKVLGDRELAETLGRNARATALERHDPDRIAARTLEIYRAVVADSRTI